MQHSIPLECAEHIGVVVTPWRHSRPAEQGHPAPVVGQRFEVFGPLRQNDPDRRPLPLLAFLSGDSEIRPAQADQIAVVCQVCQHGTQLEVPAGDVARDDSTGRQLIQVQREGLASYQMHWHSIGTERIHDDQSVTALGALGQPKAGVSDDDAQLARTLLKERELSSVLGNPLDNRINFVEVKLLSLGNVAGQRACPEAHHSHRRPSSPIAQPLGDDTNGEAAAALLTLRSRA
jgi:hypothetical protein